MQKALKIIQDRSSYVRALNTIISDGNNLYLSCIYSEDPDYFQLRMKRTDQEICICSRELDLNQRYELIPNGSILKL